MKNILYHLAAFSLLLASCNKEKTYPHYNIPQDLKDYFYYKKGSYWIFEDQKTAATDSFYVKDTYEFTQRNYNESKSDMVTITIQQHNLAATWEFSIHPFGTNLRIFPQNSLAPIDYWKMTSELPFQTDSKWLDSMQLQLSYMSNKTIGSFNAPEVYRFSIASDKYQINDTIHFNKLQGFLMFNLNNKIQQHDWVLKRWNVIR